MIYIEEKITSKVPGKTSLFVSFNYNENIVNAIKSLSCAVYDKKTHIWELPIIKLHELLDKLCVFDEIVFNILPDEQEQEFINYEIGPFKSKPFKYQEEGIQYALNHDKFLLLDAPGLGKSLQAIYAAQEIKKRTNIEHCLIICGVNTLKNNWKKEINTHSDLSCMILGERVKRTGAVRVGPVKDRLEDLKNPIEEFFVITNIETLRDNNIIKELTKGKANKFDMIIFDECHTAKNPTSQQGNHLLKLTNAKYKIGLTGTLLVNNPLDAFVPLKWLGVENCTYTNFKSFYCNYVGTIINGYRNVDFLKDTISNNSLRRTKDLLDLPPKNIIHEFLDMEPLQENFYNEVKQGIKDQVDKVDLKTNTVLSLVGRLRQASTCPSILSTQDIPSSKIDRVVQLVNEIVENGDKVVVFSVFKETLNVLMDKLKDLKPLLCTGEIDDNIVSQNIDKFQNNENEDKVMLCTAQKMGTGITLTKASYAIFLDSTWTAAQNLQCEDRIYRIGSKEPVFIYYLWNNDTIDEHVKDLVETKAGISDFIIDDKINENYIDNLRKYIQDL